MTDVLKNLGDGMEPAMVKFTHMTELNELTDSPTD